MAKRRGFFRRAGRSVAKFYRRQSSRAQINPLTTVLTGLGYGATRKYAASAIAPVSNMVPGGLGDELILGAAGWLLMKQKNNIVKSAGHTILATESYRVGENITSGMGTTQSVSAGYVYG